MEKEQVENLEEGQLVEGTIAFIKDYGVAIEVSVGFHGLLHVSDVSQQSIEDLNKIFNVGDLIRAVIIHIDRQKQRVSLSTSVLEEMPGDMIIDPKKVFQDAKNMAKKIFREEWIMFRCSNFC